MSGLAGEAFVAIWHDIEPSGLDDFYQWHHREHMPERLGIPGFRRGRRYIRIAGDGQTFFNLYEVDSFEVLVGQDYLNRLNSPTPWTRQAVQHFRSVTRGLCRVAGSLGLGQGGVMATLRIIAAAPDRGEALRRHLLREAMPAMLDAVGVLGAHLGFTDEAGSRIETAEKKVRSNPTEIPSWVLLVEGVSAEHVRRASVTALDAAALSRYGAGGPPIAGFYQLEATRLKTAWTAG